MVNSKKEGVVRPGLIVTKEFLYTVFPTGPRYLP